VSSIQNIRLIHIRPTVSTLHKLQHQNQEGSQPCSLPEQKGFSLFFWLDKNRTSWSLISILGEWFDKYLDVILYPKVSQKLEINKLSKQTHFLPCTRLNPVLHDFMFGLGWMTKRPPNSLQLVLLQSWDLELEGDDSCRKVFVRNLLK